MVCFSFSGTVLVLENENSEFEDIIKEKEPNEHEVGVKMNVSVNYLKSEKLVSDNCSA